MDRQVLVLEGLQHRFMNTLVNQIRLGTLFMANSFKLDFQSRPIFTEEAGRSETTSPWEILEHAEERSCRRPTKSFSEGVNASGRKEQDAITCIFLRLTDRKSVV